MDIIKEQFVTKATVGEIWHALTDRDELENWWSEGVVLEPKVGGKFCERWEDDDGAKQMASGKVTACKKMQSITFTWTEKDWPKGCDTQVTFVIEDQGKLRSLSIEHSGWEKLPPAKQKKIIKDFQVGWKYHMQELKEYLDF